MRMNRKKSSRLNKTKPLKHLPMTISSHWNTGNMRMPIFSMKDVWSTWNPKTFQRIWRKKWWWKRSNNRIRSNPVSRAWHLTSPKKASLKLGKLKRKGIKRPMNTSKPNRRNIWAWLWSKVLFGKDLCTFTKKTTPWTALNLKRIINDSKAPCTMGTASNRTLKTTSLRARKCSKMTQWT